MNLDKPILRIISIILIYAFLVSGVSFAMDPSDFALAPPSFTDPPCQIIYDEKTDEWDVITYDDVIKSWDLKSYNPEKEELDRVDEYLKANPGKTREDAIREVLGDRIIGAANHNRWAFVDVGYLIGQMLVFTKKYKLQNPKDILIPLIKKHLKNRDGMAEILLEGYDIDGIEEAREGQVTTGFFIPITRNGMPAYKLFYNLREGETNIPMRDGMSIYVKTIVLEDDMGKQKNIADAIRVKHGTYIDFISSILTYGIFVTTNAPMVARVGANLPDPRREGFGDRGVVLIFDVPKELLDLESCDDVFVQVKRPLKSVRLPEELKKDLRRKIDKIRMRVWDIEREVGRELNPWEWQELDKAADKIERLLKYDEEQDDEKVLLKERLVQFPPSFINIEETLRANRGKVGDEVFAELEKWLQGEATLRGLQKNDASNPESDAKRQTETTSETLYQEGEIKILSRSFRTTLFDVTCNVDANINLYIDLCRKCSANCHFCITKLKTAFAKKVLTATEFLSALDRSLQELQKVNPSVMIVGGEPTVDREKFVGAMDLIRKYGLRKPILVTNASNLEPYLDYVNDADRFEHINISRHHYDDRKNNVIFDSQRIPTTQRLREILSRIRNIRSVRFNTMILREGINSYEEVMKFVNYASSLGVTNISFSELSMLDGVDYYAEEIEDYTKRQFVDIESILGFINGNPDFQLLNTTKGPYYIAWVYHYKPLNMTIVFKRTDMKKMDAFEKTHTDNIAELVFHTDASVNGSWIPNLKQLSPSPDKDKEMLRTAALNVTPDSERIHATNFHDNIEVTQAKEMERAKAADEEPQPTIVVLGTNWIKGYEKGRYLQYDALNPLIGSIRTYCESKGIPFIDDDDKNLIARINAERAKDGMANAKVIVLAGEDTVKGDDFASLRNDEKNAFVVGVNSEELTIDSYIRLMEMLTMVLKLSAGLEVTQDSTPITIKKDDKFRIYIFTPHAEPMNYELLKHIYEVQKFA